jgi:7-cyano-7-deazaguanine synthase
MPSSKICVLASGGVESSALLYLSAKKYSAVYPLYVSHGFLWEKAERYWLRRVLARLGKEFKSIRPLTVIRYPLSPVYGGHWSLSGRKVPAYASPDRAVFLPGRNVILLSLASAFCYVRGIPRLALGVLAGNPFPDSRKGFTAALERAFKKGYARELRIEAPFRRWLKKDVIRKAAGTPWELTFSCLRPRGKDPCGNCNKCAEREKALQIPGR